MIPSPSQPSNMVIVFGDRISMIIDMMNKITI